MADKAWILCYKSVVPTSNVGEIIMTAEVAFMRDNEAGAAMNDLVPITLLSADTLNQRRQKISAAVVAHGAARGFNMVGTDIDMPDYLKGV